MMTAAKPAGWAPGYSSPFGDTAVAAAYRFRPPYSAELFATLAELITDPPRSVLDLGCGTGDLAIGLLEAAGRVDALDVSAAMVTAGCERAGGDHPRLRWIVGPAESAPIAPPYSLVVAGDSLHWMDWPAVISRIAPALTPNRWLAIVGRVWATGAPEERELLARHSTNPDWRPLNIVEELEKRGLFAREGARPFSADWYPNVTQYIGARHSQAAYPTEPLARERADAELRSLLGRLVAEGRVRTRASRLALTVNGGVAWGRPAPKAAFRRGR
jgi:SAM-dependent methyltransferase